jgi:hypothetical protein
MALTPEICREHQIAQTQYYQWRHLSAVPDTGRSLLGGREAGADQWGPGGPQTEEALKREVEKLQCLIGKQAVAI